MTQPSTRQSDRALLRKIAVRAMRERGLDPEMPAAALAQADAMSAPPRTTEEPTHGRYMARVCILSFRTHEPQVDALVEDLAAAIEEAP